MPLDPYANIPLDLYLAERRRRLIAERNASAGIGSLADRAERAYNTRQSGLDPANPLVRAEAGLGFGNDIDLDRVPILDTTGGAIAQSLQPKAPEPSRIAESLEDMPSFADVLGGANGSVRRAREFEDVIGDASSTAQGARSIAEADRPQPGSLRVNVGGGWQDYDPDNGKPLIAMDGEGQTRSAYDPIDQRSETYRPAIGGGTVSMMSAPENAHLATRASRLEDLQQEAAERDLADPNWRQRDLLLSQTQSAIAREVGKQRALQESIQANFGTFINKAQPFQDVVEEFESKLAELRSRNDIAPEDKARLDNHYQQQIGAAKQRIRLIQQALGMATGEAPGSLYAASSDGLGIP